MGYYEQSVALLIFFPAFTTITVGIRVFVRTRLCKGAFGWDDVLLIITNIGLIVFAGLDWKALDAGYGTEKFAMYSAARDDVCYIISGVVKVSVALVLYKLDIRRGMRVILIADMVVLTAWTIVVTIILGVGCTGNSLFHMSVSTCSSTNYAQEASYVVFNVLHLIIPINMLWGVKVRGGLKWAVLALFSVGLLAALAAVMKLRVVLATFRTGLSPALWYEAQLWAVSEHGLSLFAAAVLAIRPIFAYVTSRIRNKSVSVGMSSSSGSGGGDAAAGEGARRSSGSRTRKIVGWWFQPLKPLLFTTKSAGEEGTPGGSRSEESGARSREDSVEVAPGAGGQPWADVELGGFWQEPEVRKVPHISEINLA